MNYIMKNCEIISYYNYFQMPDECCHGFRTSQGARGFDRVHRIVTLNTFPWFLLELYSRSSGQKLLLATEMFDITLLALVNHVTFPTQGGG